MLYAIIKANFSIARCDTGTKWWCRECTVLQIESSFLRHIQSSHSLITLFVGIVRYFDTRRLTHMRHQIPFYVLWGDLLYRMCVPLIIGEFLIQGGFPSHYRYLHMRRKISFCHCPVDFCVYSCTLPHTPAHYRSLPLTPTHFRICGVTNNYGKMAKAKRACVRLGGVVHKVVNSVSDRRLLVMGGESFVRLRCYSKYKMGALDHGRNSFYSGTRRF